jgi:hypothetical protein
MFQKIASDPQRVRPVDQRGGRVRERHANNFAAG